MSKFNIGDRIVVYGIDDDGKPLRIKTTVEGIAPEGMLYLPYNTCYGPGYGGYDLTIVHPAQCRKLKKKKPRRLYVKRDFILDPYPTVRASFDPFPYALEFVEVRKRK